MHQFLAAILLAFTVCLSQAEPLHVASLNTFTTELAREIGGSQVTVDAIVGPGIDPHEFEPTPADLQKIEKAGLILASGKGIEGYLGKVGGKPGRVLKVGDQLPSLKMRAEKPHTPKKNVDEEINQSLENPSKPNQTVGGGLHVGTDVEEDPHWWHSVTNFKKGAVVVQAAFIKLQPSGKEEFIRNTAAYLAKLDVLEKDLRSELALLPRDKRKLVTSHDALQYFAKDFGFTIYAVEGISTQDEPSSGKVADLIKLIKTQKVKAVFAENIENPKVLQEITRETGATLGGNLYADSLGTGSEGTYEGMMRYNMHTIVSALK